MINRLVTALKNGISITGADASFYLHELKEAQLMQSGIFSVYHPDVIKMQPGYWNNGWFNFWGITR